MVVLGGGVIGCEYAALFAALGVEVDTGVDRKPLAAGGGQRDRRKSFERTWNIWACGSSSTIASRGECGDGEARLSVESGETVRGEVALIASGRQSNVEALGLEQLGIKLGSRGLVVVNEHYQTNVPNVYAAGDCDWLSRLASTSMEQARVAMVHAFDLGYKDAVSAVLPIAIYTVPEIGMVGLTEDACQADKIAYLVGRA